MKICNNCGAQLPDEAVFCKVCGAATADGTTVLDNNTADGTAILNEEQGMDTTVLNDNAAEGTAILNEEPGMDTTVLNADTAESTAILNEEPGMDTTVLNADTAEGTAILNDEPGMDTTVLNGNAVDGTTVLNNPSNGAPVFTMPSPQTPPAAQPYAPSKAAAPQMPPAAQSFSPGNMAAPINTAPAPAKKKSKLPIIIIAAVAAVILLIVIIAIIVSGSSNTSYSSNNYSYNSSDYSYDDDTTEPQVKDSSPENIVGTISGNTYTNNFAGFSVNLPSGWEFLDDAQRAENGYEIDSVTGKPIERRTDVTTYYDMFMYDSKTNENFQVMIDKSTSPDFQNATIGDLKAAYLKSIYEQYEKDGVTILEKEDSAGMIEVNGIQYSYGTIKLDYNSVIIVQQIAVTKITTDVSVVVSVTGGEDLEQEPFKYFNLMH